MNKTQNNYAFVDGQNLNLAIQDMGWKLDFRRFRAYLREKYGVGTAYYFIGFVEGNSDLYKALQLDGYVLVFKPTFRNRDSAVKGNCDAELVLQAMIDLDKYERAIIVTGDGDFGCLVRHLSKIGKLECALAPNRFKCSHLLNIAAGKRIAYMNDLKPKLEYKGTP